MGKIQKVLWWILYYAITWFCLLIVWGIIEEIGVFPKTLMGFLALAVFLVSGWFATRKVKQKAIKMEMEQRSGSFAYQQPVQASSASNPTSQITNNAPLKPQNPAMPQPPVMKEKDAVPAKNEASPQSVLSPQENLPNLNNATVDDLTKLSGVNRILAMKIISVREKDGTYNSFEDLFSRVQLTSHIQEELLRHFSIPSSVEGRFIDF